MRALRVVGITEGGDVVLEDPGRRERFSVPADEQLRAAARGDLTRLGQIAIELESQLRPREIQARIRAGASVDQVASAAGVPVQKIERFAYPVLLERSRTAEVAQRAHPVRADGPDVRTLGDVVAHTFGLRGQEYTEAEWDSWKGEDGRWVVALSWRAGRSDNRAHWTFQPGAHGGTVTAVDEHASDLVEGLPLRPLRPVGPVIDIARPDDPAPGPHAPAELRAAASDTVRTPVRPPDRVGADRSVAERAAVERAAADRVSAEQAATERAAAEQAEADRAAAEQAEADRVAAEQAEADRAAAEQAEAERAAAEQAEAERAAAER
ncbi:MAG: septation protein SepH, partial [Pseudonocardiales bacterium]|nr:septation protein SepH [Pseudonocardiales bacterium]